MPELTCADCGRQHAVETSRCPCGGPLDPAEAGEPITEDQLPGLGDREGLYELAAPGRHGVSLGEGSTPLVDDEELGAAFKLEGTSPTGSFKDRGASVVLSVARQAGVQRVTEDSSGNAGAAIAAYAGRAGLACQIFSPGHATEAKRSRMQALGAEVNLVEGPRSAVTEAAAKAGAGRDAYYASHTYPPWFIQGCSTLALELAVQTEQLPHTIVAPAAMGSVVLGLHRGLARMKAGGAIDQLPRLVAVQAAGSDPIARRFDAGLDGDNRLADGLLVPEPPRLEQIVEAIQSTDGTALAVDEQATREAMQDLHARGLLVEASAATSLAGIRALRETGWLAEDEQPIGILTGAWTPSYATSS